MLKIIVFFESAMNRHRANELLYEASKRATMVVAQAMQGLDTFSVAEFGDGTVQNATLGVVKVGHSRFGITILPMNKSVCESIMKSIGTNSTARYMALAESPETKGDEAGKIWELF